MKTLLTLFAFALVWGIGFGPSVAAPPTLPAGAVAISASISGNGNLETGLHAAAGKTAYICALESAPTIVGAAVSQVSVGGIASPQKFSPTAAENFVRQHFTPCLPASAPGGEITISSLADGTTELNAWGYQQ